MAFVRVTLGAGLHARLAADAAVRVNEKFHHKSYGSYGSYGSDGTLIAPITPIYAFLTRTAQTLYSGIFEIGSCAEIVNWFALFAPAQWYGMKIVSGRMVVTTCACSVIVPRRG